MMIGICIPERRDIWGIQRALGRYDILARSDWNSTRANDSFLGYIFLISCVDFGYCSRELRVFSTLLMLGML